MKKSVELAKAIAMMRKDVQALVDAGNAEDANAKAKELNALVAEYNKVVSAENAAKNNFITNQVCGGKKTMNFKEKNRIFNKLLLGKALTAEEVEYANTLRATLGTGQNETVDADGAVLVPQEHYNQVQEAKKSYIPLSELCWKFPTKSGSGVIPTLGATTDKLVSFDELDTLTANKVAFGKVSYKLGLKGDLIPVSNALMSDADVNVIDVIGNVFAHKAVLTENTDILDLCALIVDATSDYFDENAVSEGSDYKAINVILNKYLDPAVSARATIVTNQSGFDYLDGVEDKNGRPLLTVSLADPTQKMYKGRKIVVLNDADFPNVNGAIPMWVGDFAEAIAFVYKEGLEVAVSKEAGFTSYATLLRAVERYDVQFRNSKAMGYVEITPETDDNEGGEG